MAASFDRQSLGMRVRDHARWVGLVMVAGLVPLGLGAAVLIRESDRAAQRQQDARLTTAASSQAAALSQSLGRARALLRLSAASPVWRDAVAAPGSLQATIAADGRPIRRVHAALAGLRAGYGRRLVGAANAIDESGREFAAEWRGGAVPIALLAAGQTRAPFFWPSMSLPVGAVYQTTPYISPDTHQWVISTSTTAAVGEYDRVVIQLELPIESLRREALERGRGFEVSVIDARTGLVVFDSTNRQSVGAALAPPDMEGVRRVMRSGGAAGLADLRGRRVAFRHVPQADANANDWYVVVDAPQPPGLRPTGAAEFVLALMVLALGGLGLALGRQSAAVRREAERTAHQAMHDELTGLPNRLLFRDRTERAIAAARREGIETGVLLMDVDGFREINDTLGHHAGDRVIAAVAARLRGVLRSSDTLARLGGDEFAILMPRVMEESAPVQLAGRIRTALAAPLVLRGVPLDIRASIGIAVHPDHGEDVDSLLQHAEIAMYVAKDTRTSMQVYDPSTDDHSTERLALVGELRHALDRGDIIVHYQPKATMWDGRVRSVEALVRWQHPERGLIGPYEFVHLAEHTGLIRPLTHHVLRVALEQCRAWRDRGLDLSVAVNLSVRDLVDLDLPGAIAAELDRFRLEPRFLGIEITETMLVLDPNRTIEVLARLHEMGVRISLDDFGTGYSSLSYLQRLPVDELKIDRSFIRDLTGSDTDTSIVEATVALARKLGLTTVAEGVECAETWERLVRLGCDVAQGYFISRPLPADELEAWLAGADRHAAMSDRSDDD
jgi:diguanylate cyclase (GGDEF)-like protein